MTVLIVAPQFNMAVQKTFAADSARFVFHGPTAAPSSPAWTSIFATKNWNSGNCNVLASLPQQGTFAAGGIEAATTGSFDLNGTLHQRSCLGPPTDSPPAVRSLLHGRRLPRLAGARLRLQPVRGRAERRQPSLLWQGRGVAGECCALAPRRLLRRRCALAACRCCCTLSLTRVHVQPSSCP